MVLHLVFKKCERKGKLHLGQMGEVDFVQAMMRRPQGGKHSLLHARRLKAARETHPRIRRNRPEVAFTCADDAPELVCDTVGAQLWEIHAQGRLVEMRDEVVGESECSIQSYFQSSIKFTLHCFLLQGEVLFYAISRSLKVSARDGPRLRGTSANLASAL